MAVHLEGQIQRKLISWRNSITVGVDPFVDLKRLHSVPNGYQIGKPKKNSKGVWVNTSAQIAKAEGLTSGVWDLCFPKLRVRMKDGSLLINPGVYLETKKDEKSSQEKYMRSKNPNQIWWRDELMEDGWKFIVYHEWHVAAKFLINYLYWDMLTDDECNMATKGLLPPESCESIMNKRING